MKATRALSTPASVAESCFGPATFWAELQALKASIPPPRDHFTWEEWDQFWELAQRYGMMDYAPHPEDPQAAKTFRFGAIGSGLARQFQRVKEARDVEGIDAYRFHLREEKAIEADERVRLAEIERQRQEAIARREREEESRKNKFGGNVRHFKPRAVHDDDEVMI